MNDIFENTETMKENEHPRFYTAESVMRGHPDKLCDLIADNVLDACLQHDPASRVACEVMATHGHIIVAGEITTSAKPDVFNTVRDTLRDVGYDPKAYQIDCYIHDQSPDIAGAVEPELAEGEDEDTLGAGDQGVMVGYACNETPEYLPMPVVAAQRLVTLLEISRMTGVIPDIGPDGKVQVTMEYNGDTPVRIWYDWEHEGVLQLATSRTANTPPGKTVSPIIYSEQLPLNRLLLDWADKKHSLSVRKITRADYLEWMLQWPPRLP